MHGVPARDAEFMGEGIFRGKLYDVGEYPAAVPSDDAAEPSNELSCDSLDENIHMFATPSDDRVYLAGGWPHEE